MIPSLSFLSGSIRLFEAKGDMISTVLRLPKTKENQIGWQIAGVASEGTVGSRLETALHGLAGVSSFLLRDSDNPAAWGFEPISLTMSVPLTPAGRGEQRR